MTHRYDAPLYQVAIHPDNLDVPEDLRGQSVVGRPIGGDARDRAMPWIRLELVGRFRRGAGGEVAPDRVWVQERDVRPCGLPEYLRALGRAWEAASGRL